MCVSDSWPKANWISRSDIGWGFYTSEVRARCVTPQPSDVSHSADCGLIKATLAARVALTLTHIIARALLSVSSAIWRIDLSALRSVHQVILFTCHRISHVQSSFHPTFIKPSVPMCHPVVPASHLYKLHPSSLNPTIHWPTLPPSLTSIGSISQLTIIWRHRLVQCVL